MTAPACPTELRRLYKAGRVIPFVGAGASMSVSWSANGTNTRGPSWRELVDEAARLLGVNDPELLRIRGHDLQIVEYLRTKEGTIQPLINWLVKRMTPLDADLVASPLLTALSQLKECNLLYTTNYDDFLERRLSIAGRSVLSIRSESDMSNAAHDTQVVKFHGDFARPETMVLSESDYERRMRLETPLDLKLRSDILGRALLFVGYSFRDPNVAYLFRLVTDHFGDLPQSFAGRRAYIIYHNPSDFEMQLFHSRRIEVIPVTGRDVSASIADVLGQLSS